MILIRGKTTTTAGAVIGPGGADAAAGGAAEVGVILHQRSETD